MIESIIPESRTTLLESPTSLLESRNSEFEGFPKTMATEQLLDRLYGDVEKPGGLSSIRKLWTDPKHYKPDIKLQQVKEYLKGQDSYTLHGNIRIPGFTRFYPEVLSVLYKPIDIYVTNIVQGVFVTRTLSPELKTIFFKKIKSPKLYNTTHYHVK